MLPNYFGDKGIDPNYTPTHDDLKANGCVGVYQLTDTLYSEGYFLQPWLTANLVSSEVERINIVQSQGAIYLFMTSHGNKCALISKQPSLTNRDFMIGFRADRLFGALEPLNTSALVLQQTSSGQLYTGQDTNVHYVYSWLMVPTNNEHLFECISYASHSTDDEGNIIPVRTAGPSVLIAIEGLNTKILDIKYNIQPA